MKFRLHIATLVLAMALTQACSQAPPPQLTPPAAATQPPRSKLAEASTRGPSWVSPVEEATLSARQATGTAGGNGEAKGCIGSAGYTWSHLHNQCIRIFESGIRLEPKHRSLDKTQSAFAVFAPADESLVEMFLPGRAPFILARDGDKQSWRDGAYVLTRTKRSYALAEAKGALLFEGAVPK